MRKILFSVVLGVAICHFSFAQKHSIYSSSTVYKNIQKLNFLGSVLYVGAHPDDENTAMISYVSNKLNARVAYLAMTRGDGGQNLLGPEMRSLLGVIRTQELLMARRVDGGEQFFTRANDFGFSKNPEETFQMWDRDSVLADVVWRFRKFRPDVVIDRFDHRTEGDTHGHHTASAILSNEAFDLSGKADKFPGQLKYTSVWQPQKLYVNISWLRYGHKEKWEKLDKSNFLKIDLGTYLPIKGESNTEISALSRSQHKSQGFGVAGSRGADPDYLEPIKGDFPQHDDSIFAGINTTWSRVKGGKAIGNILYKVQADYDFKNPAASLPQLVKAYQLIQKIPDPYWRKLKTREIKKVIAGCAGLYLQASSSVPNKTPGEDLTVNLEAINRSDAKIKLQEVSISGSKGKSYTFNQELNPDRDFQEKATFKIPQGTAYTTPYWLRQPHSISMYKVADQKLIGLAETPPQFIATFQTVIRGVPIDFKRKLIYKTATPDKGEIEQSFAIVPEVSLKMHNKTMIFADRSSKEIKIDVKAYKDEVSGTLRLNHPKNWKVSPDKIKLDLAKKGSERTVAFTVTPPNSKAEGELSPAFSTDQKTFTRQLHVISYPHIPTQTVLLPAKTKAIRLAIETRGHRIGYIEGSGDDVPQSLREIGYKVSLLSGNALRLENLKKFDAIVLGVRAYNTNRDLVFHQNALFDYIKQGGTVVTQYNKSYNLKTDKLAPFALHLSHDRVTDEHSKVTFLAPDNPVLNQPNKLTTKDFEGWVQERGLYFPDRWADEFTPILGMHDPGEKELKSSLLVARYGKGYFVYTGLSFFRELPAGVAGAYRLFANLLALGNNDHPEN